MPHRLVLLAIAFSVVLTLPSEEPSVGGSGVEGLKTACYLKLIQENVNATEAVTIAIDESGELLNKLAVEVREHGYPKVTLISDEPARDGLVYSVDVPAELPVVDGSMVEVETLVFSRGSTIAISKYRLSTILSAGRWSVIKVSYLGGS